MKLRHLARLGFIAAALARRPAPLRLRRNPARSNSSSALAPGGAIDPYARIIADQMSKMLGQTIIVENKPGASGNISAQYIVDQPADGSMIWVGTQAFTEINPSVFTTCAGRSTISCRSSKASRRRWCSSSHPSVPANTFAEFLAWAKANRGKLSYSSYQPGTPSHFLGFQLNEKFDLDLTHVPYRGSGLQANGADRRPFAVRLRPGQHHRCRSTRRQAQGVRHHQRRALAAR